jgi:hypothetical protein
LEMIGVGKGRPSPPSEPCVRFSRTRLSGRLLPHRDGLASRSSMPGDRLRASAGDARRRRVDPVTRAANIRSVHTDDSTQARSRGSRVWHACVAVAGTDALGISPPSVLVFTDQPSCPPSLGAALLSARLVRPRSTLGRGCPPASSKDRRLRHVSPWSSSCEQALLCGL